MFVWNEEWGKLKPHRTKKMKPKNGFLCKSPFFDSQKVDLIIIMSKMPSHAFQVKFCSNKHGEAKLSLKLIYRKSFSFIKSFDRTQRTLKTWWCFKDLISFVKKCEKNVKKWCGKLMAKLAAAVTSVNSFWSNILPSFSLSLSFYPSLFLSLSFPWEI